MPYTLWHCGVLIGETDFQSQGRRKRQWADVFRPTPYGIEIFPRLTGMLTAAADIKDQMRQRGIDPESCEDLTPEQFESTPAGRKVVDIGRALSDVQIRDPDGARVEFASIAFMDLTELDTLSRRLGCRSNAQDFAAIPDAPRYIVSATFRDRRASGQSRAEFRARPGSQN